MDSDNPVMALVSEGMALEASGSVTEAAAKYADAWDRATDDYERCVAAHYVPRLIDDPAQKLHWNVEALRLADQVDDDRVAGFYSSLHANVGWCQVQLGDRAEALESYERAEQALPSVAAGAYRDQVASTIATMLASLRA